MKIRLRGISRSVARLLASMGEERERKPHRVDFLIVDLTTGTVTKLKGDGKMAYTLRVDRRLTGIIDAQDIYGNAAKMDGVPVWTSSDTNLLVVTPAADGMSALLEPVGPAGASVQIKAEGDADLGPGVKPFTGLGVIDLIAGEAVTFNMKFVNEEPK